MAGGFTKIQDGIVFPGDDNGEDVEVHHHFHPAGHNTGDHYPLEYHHGMKHRGVNDAMNSSANIISNQFYHPNTMRNTYATTRAPNWRVMSHNGISAKSRQPVFVRSSSAKAFRNTYGANTQTANYNMVPVNFVPDFLPRSIDRVPTGTDWLSAQCRTRQERALCKQGW